MLTTVHTPTHLQVFITRKLIHWSLNMSDHLVTECLEEENCVIPHSSPNGSVTCPLCKTMTKSIQSQNTLTQTICTCLFSLIELKYFCAPMLITKTVLSLFFVCSLLLLFWFLFVCFSVIACFVFHWFHFFSLYVYCILYVCMKTYNKKVKKKLKTKRTVSLQVTTQTCSVSKCVN